MRNDVNGHFISYSLNEEDISSKIKLSYGVQSSCFMWAVLQPKKPLPVD